MGIEALIECVLRSSSGLVRWSIGSEK